MLERDLGDQEKAYILFYKYVECVQRIQKHHEYKKDEKYYVSMFNLKKNMRLGIENLETLTAALEQRYEEKEAEAVAEKLSKVEISHSYRVIFLTGPPLKMSLDWPPPINPSTGPPLNLLRMRITKHLRLFSIIRGGQSGTLTFF